jgi:hypothetical protein
MFLLVASGHLCLRFVQNSFRIGGLPGKFMFKDQRIITGKTVRFLSSATNKVCSFFNSVCILPLPGSSIFCIHSNCCCLVNLMAYRISTRTLHTMSAHFWSQFRSQLSLTRYARHVLHLHLNQQCSSSSL